MGTTNRSMIENLNEKIKDTDDKATKNSIAIQNFQDKSVKTFESIDTRLQSHDETNININEQLQTLHDNSGTKEDLNSIIKTNEQAIDELKKGFNENIANIMT